MLHVTDTDELDTNDRWWGSGGADWSVLPGLFLGAEVQSAYGNDVGGGKISCRLVPLKGWRPERYHDKIEHSRPEGKPLTSDGGVLVFAISKDGRGAH